jgi:response regulator of citrate/malate metabolism
MAGQSIYRGEPVTAREVAEMRRRHAAGQSINYIANAMGRSWTSVNRYARGLSWVETRDPRRSRDEHLEYFRVGRRRHRHLRRLHEALSAAQEFVR